MAMIQSYEPLIGSMESAVVVRLHTLRKVTNPKKGARNQCSVLLLSDGQRVRTIVMPFADRTKIANAIATHVTPGASLVTDCHFTMNVATSYGNCRTNITWDRLDDGCGLLGRKAIHGFLRPVYEALRDQFRSVFVSNLWLYLKEFEFRYNRRQNSQFRFWDLVCTWPELKNSEVIRIMDQAFIPAQGKH